MTETDVAIIGLGPSGAVLAHLLGQCGLKVLVLERDAEIYPLPRAVHFDDEVMRVFQSIGLAEQIVAETLVNPGMRFVDSEGALLLDWSRPQEVGRHAWHASYRFHQPSLEQVLNDGLSSRRSVRVRRRCEAFLVEDRQDHVELRFENLSTGAIETVRAAQVVGCDGARSLIRRFIGPGVEDLGFHERWLVVDVRLTEPRDDLGSHSVQHCHPEMPVTYTRQPGDRRRWEIRLPATDGGPKISQADQVWPLLARWITPDDAELERFATYSFHSLCAKRWRAGRLWIAGDAAHQSPPFMGQGMCAGIRDVANLAWKLVMAVRGQADDALLDSYQSERLPNVRRYISTAVRLGGLINAKDPAAALAMAMPSDGGVNRMASLVSTLGPGLGTGSAGGQLFGQPRLLDGRLLDDVIGYRPVLVLDAVLASLLTPDPAIRTITTDDAPDLKPALDELGTCGAIIRPDRYILATGKSVEEVQRELSTPLVQSMFAAV